MNKRLVYEAFTLNVPTSWQEIRGAEDGTDWPLTLADPIDGVGALQLSVATYRAGPVPSIRLTTLLGLLEEFSLGRELTCQTDLRQISASNLLATANYRKGEDQVRVWYVSDGSNLALATYVCDWDQQLTEAEICDSIVASLEFLR